MAGVANNGMLDSYLKGPSNNRSILSAHIGINRSHRLVPCRHETRQDDPHMSIITCQLQNVGELCELQLTS